MKNFDLALFERGIHQMHLIINKDLYLRERASGNRPMFDKLSNVDKCFVNQLLHEHDEEVAEQAERAVAAERKAQAEFESAKEEAQEYFNTPQFREDVIEELMAEGCTRLMAEGRTRDQARLFAEAARLNLM